MKNNTPRLRRILVDIVVPSVVTEAHDRSFPGMLIFYKHISSRLFRLKLAATDAMPAATLQALTSHCIVKHGFAFVHEKDYEHVMLDLTEAGVENVVFAMPQLEFSKNQEN